MGINSGPEVAENGAKVNPDPPTVSVGRNSGQMAGQKCPDGTKGNVPMGKTKVPVGRK